MEHRIFANQKEVGYVFQTRYNKWRANEKDGLRNFLADTKEEAVKGLLDKLEITKCPKCGCLETYEADDQYGRWYRECPECGYSKRLTNEKIFHPEENEEEVCDRCGGGGCPQCEPHKYINGKIYWR